MDQSAERDHLINSEYPITFAHKRQTAIIISSKPREKISSSNLPLQKGQLAPRQVPNPQTALAKRTPTSGHYEDPQGYAQQTRTNKNKQQKPSFLNV